MHSNGKESLNPILVLFSEVLGWAPGFGGSPPLILDSGMSLEQSGLSRA